MAHIDGWYNWMVMVFLLLTGSLTGISSILWPNMNTKPTETEAKVETAATMAATTIKTNKRKKYWKISKKMHDITYNKQER